MACNYYDESECESIDCKKCRVYWCSKCKAVVRAEKGGILSDSSLCMGCFKKIYG